MILPLMFLLGQTAFQTNPVMELAKTLIGGRWEGTVGKGMPVTFRFTQTSSGLLVGDGVVGDPKKNPMTARMTLGWDDAAKQVYYLDQHGTDTVYFGHVTREGNALVFDFRGLVGDPGHYRTRSTFDKDTYTAEMSYEKDGKWNELGFHLGLHRKR